MKQRIMTPLNIGEFTFCELLQAVKDDLKLMEKKGVVLDMSEWVEVKHWAEDEPNYCSVCLGGAAVMGFFPETPLEDFHRVFVESVGFATPEEKNLDRLADLMNAIRYGNIRSTFDLYSKITGKLISTDAFCEVYDKLENKRLIGYTTYEEAIDFLNLWIKTMKPYDF